MGRAHIWGKSLLFFAYHPLLSLSPSFLPFISSRISSFLFLFFLLPPFRLSFLKSLHFPLPSFSHSPFLPFPLLFTSFSSLLPLCPFFLLSSLPLSLLSFSPSLLPSSSSSFLLHPFLLPLSSHFPHPSLLLFSPLPLSILFPSSLTIFQPSFFPPLSPLFLLTPPPFSSSLLFSSLLFL